MTANRIIDPILVKKDGVTLGRAETLDVSGSVLTLSVANSILALTASVSASQVWVDKSPFVGCLTDVSSDVQSALVKLDSTILAFHAPRVVLNITASYSASYGNVLLCNTSGSTQFIVWLPTAVSSSGQEIVVKKINVDAANLVISASAGQRIDADRTLVVASQWSAVQMISDGANWFII